MIKQEVPRILGPSLRDPYSTVESPGLCLAVVLTPTITPNTIIFPRAACLLCVYRLQPPCVLSLACSHLLSQPGRSTCLAVALAGILDLWAFTNTLNKAEKNQEETVRQSPNSPSQMEENTNQSNFTFHFPTSPDSQHFHTINHHFYKIQNQFMSTRGVMVMACMFPKKAHGFYFCYLILKEF